LLLTCLRCWAGTKPRALPISTRSSARSALKVGFLASLAWWRAHTPHHGAHRPHIWCKHKTHTRFSRCQEGREAHLIVEGQEPQRAHRGGQQETVSVARTVSHRSRFIIMIVVGRMIVFYILSILCGGGGGVNGPTTTVAALTSAGDVFIRTDIEARSRRRRQAIVNVECRLCVRMVKH
jgi:hypothetical protein